MNDDIDMNESQTFNDNESKDSPTIRPLSVSVETNSNTPISSNASIASLTPPADAKSSESEHTIDLRPKLRLNAILASDPALQPEARDIHRIRANAIESYDIDSNCGDDDDDRDGTISPTILVPDDDPPPEKIRRRDDVPLFQPGLLNKFVVNAHANATVNNINSAELIPRVPAFMCTPCGIKFSSLSTLEAHQNFYCSHK